jgi:hypothetical protein
MVAKRKKEPLAYKYKVHAENVYKQNTQCLQFKKYSWK